MSGAKRVLPPVFFGGIFLLLSLIYVYGFLGPATQEFLRSLVIALYYGAASVTSLSLLAYGVLLFWRSTEVDSYEPVPVGEALGDDNPVEVEGVARRMRGVLRAEFSEKRVLAHEWSKNSKKIRGTDTTLDSGRKAIPFYVEDETGRVAVDVADADLRLRKETVKDEVVFRHVEGRIEPGDEVRVRGRKRGLSSDGGGVTEGDERATVYIGGGAGTDLRVSDGVEKRKAKRLRWRACLAALLGVFVLAGSVTPPNFGLF